MNADRLLAFYERIADALRMRLCAFAASFSIWRCVASSWGRTSNDEPASELLKRSRGGESAVGEGGGDQETARLSRSTLSWTRPFDAHCRSQLEMGSQIGRPRRVYDVRHRNDVAQNPSIFICSDAVDGVLDTVCQTLSMKTPGDWVSSRKGIPTSPKVMSRMAKSTKSEFCVDDILYGKLRPYFGTKSGGRGCTWVFDDRNA